MTNKEASFILANIDRRVCDDELIEALDMAIKALEQEPRWIPVSERLPETTKYVGEGEYKWYESEKCLIWFANEYAVATFNKDELTDEEDDSDGFYVVDRHYWYGLDSVDGNTYPYNDVIAWMPLPQPYKAESEDKE